MINADFASGDGAPSAWQLEAPEEGQVVEYVRESGQGHVSLFAAIVEGADWPEARLLEPFEVSRHTDYRVEVEARSLTQGRLLIALVFLDDDGDEILLRGPGSPEIVSSDWITFEGTVESPADAAAAYVVLSLPVSPELTDADSFSVDVNRVSVSELLES